MEVVMPLFFIDTSDDENFVRDDKGMEFADVEAAKDAAVATLPAMATDKLPDGDARNFLVIVRDANGMSLLQASLILKVTSLVPLRHRTSGLPGDRHRY